MTFGDTIIKIIIESWPGFIVSLIVLTAMVLSGKLVLKAHHEEILGYWKEAALKSAAQVDKMLDNDELTHSLLRSILDRAERKTGEKHEV